MSLYRLNEDCYYEEGYENLNEFRNPFKKKSKARKALDFAKKHKYAVGTGLVLASPFALRGAKAGAKYTGKKLSQANKYLADKHPGINRYAKDLGLVGAGAAVLPVPGGRRLCDGPLRRGPAADGGADGRR